jgi:hypothetical protein
VKHRYTGAPARVNAWVRLAVGTGRGWVSAQVRCQTVSGRAKRLDLADPPRANNLPRWTSDENPSEKSALGFGDSRSIGSDVVRSRGKEEVAPSAPLSVRHVGERSS